MQSVATFICLQVGAIHEQWSHDDIIGYANIRCVTWEVMLGKYSLCYMEPFILVLLDKQGEP